ncbi:hypothetical protein HC752_23655 [Vibrio sp. S9_S30]|uniref:GIY-YIG nuclease family protein n=1 Tax=Vibrio sp. S9_S30 TaxID=2720226 RepID=UPI0016819034|nr:hypothetical protein [Vibrio sp. S9_S30]MBD1559924.1 hypothetical protein [Vibrio sp. S9_S30]
MRFWLLNWALCFVTLSAFITFFIIGIIASFNSILCFGEIMFTRLFSALEIRNDINEVPNKGGVYKHFVDTEGLQKLNGVFPSKQEIIPSGESVHLLYVGMAKDLRYRLKWHLGMVNTSHSCILHGTLSTLRLSYIANHEDIDCLSKQELLNVFLDQHVYISYSQTSDYVGIEQALIKQHDLPLNIKGNQHPFVKVNKERRKRTKENYINKFT